MFLLRYHLELSCLIIHLHDTEPGQCTRFLPTVPDQKSSPTSLVLFTRNTTLQVSQIRNFAVVEITERGKILGTYFLISIARVTLMKINLLRSYN